ncbi:MAG: T9SS type A sorting domain-containing protein [Saprospiraceae bacterium]
MKTTFHLMVVALLVFSPLMENLNATISHRNSDFCLTDVIWPQDLTLNHCPDESEFGFPEITNSPCNTIDVSYEIVLFDGNSEACVVEEIHWQVIETCIYDGAELGVHRHTQIISLIDDTQPVVHYCDDLFLDMDDACQGVLNIPVLVTDEGELPCSNAPKLQVFVDLWADGTTDYEFSSLIDKNDHLPDDSNGNGIPDFYVAAPEWGQEIEITVPEIISGNLSNHKVVVKSTDGCGNVRSCSFNVEMKDRTKPKFVPNLDFKPDCIFSGSNYFAEFFASDLALISEDDCSSSDDLIFSFNCILPILNDTIIANKLININVPHYFNEKGFVDFYINGSPTKPITLSRYLDGKVYLWHPELKSASIYYFPYSEYENFVLTIADQNYNTLCQETEVHFKCFNVGSPPFFLLTGFIYRNENRKLKDFEFEFCNEYLGGYTLNTEENGFYYLQPYSTDFTLKANITDSPFNGINGRDYFMAERILLGNESDSTLILASDITQDEKITASDFSTLRKILLEIESNENPWILYPVPTSKYPWPFDDVTFPMFEYEIEKDWILVKRGDINYSAFLPESENIPDPYTNEVVVLKTNDLEVTKGYSYTIPFYISELKDFKGLWLKIKGDGISNFNILESENFYSGNNNLASDETNLFLTPKTTYTDINEDTLFYLKFQATKSGNLRNMLHLDESKFEAQCYTGSDAIISHTVLNFDFPKGEFYAIVFQNPSNAIRFEVINNSESPFKFQIFNSAGQMIYSDDLEYRENYKVFDLNGLNVSNQLLFIRIDNGVEKKIIKTLSFN